MLPQCTVFFVFSLQESRKCFKTNQLIISLQLEKARNEVSILLWNEEWNVYYYYYFGIKVGKCAMGSTFPHVSPWRNLCPWSHPPIGRYIVLSSWPLEYPSSTKFLGSEIPSTSNKRMSFTAKWFFPVLASELLVPEQLVERRWCQDWRERINIQDKFKRNSFPAQC